MIVSIDSPENYLDSEQIQALYNMKACRTIDMGGRIVECPECNTQTVLYNPCNQRGCPVCFEKNQIQWANKLKRKLLPIDHYHLVISLPDILMPIWLMDRKHFINTFFHAVDQGFKNLRKESGISPGIITVFQSHGVGLCYKPHMHCIVTSKGTDQNGNWISNGSLKYSTIIDTVKEIFIPHLMKKIPAIKRKIVRNMLRTIDDREYTLFSAIHKFNGDSIVDYLAKSTSGVAVNIKGLDLDKEKNTMTINEYHNGKKRVTVLDRPTFRERYMNHIPPKGTVTIRSYGLYSNRQKEQLEEIRKTEFDISKDIDAENDDLEKCSECKTPLHTVDSFQPGKEYPLKLQLYLKKYEDPPGHGSTLSIA